MSARNPLADRGYAGPIRVLSRSECRRFLREADSPTRPPPLDWDKGCAVTSRPFYELATHSRLIEAVSAVLGEDVMLWGASLQNRPPGEAHPWHSDMESSATAGRTVAVWIGLEHTGRRSSLRVVPYSHRFGETVQELRHRFGVRREEASDEVITRWARERDPRGGVEQTDLTDGEALIFDGRLWHGSRNGSRKTRRALLLQYAAPDADIRIPDLNHLDWPFRMFEVPRPPCILVRGDDTARVNRVLPPPVAARAAGPRLSSRVYPLQLPLPHDCDEEWRPCFIFKGATANVGHLSCHVSTLKSGCSPHPPHTHDDEEILLMLKGQADVTLPRAARKADRRMRLTAGQCAYYPPHFSHTLRAVGDGPANYLMFRWHNASVNKVSSLGFGRFRLPDAAKRAEAGDGFRVRLVFEGSTASLRKLRCHVSTLSAGSGYGAHVDAHDVAIIVLEGEVETLGQRVGPHSVIFYPGGEPHGMRNPGTTDAKYAVFEFHGR